MSVLSSWPDRSVPLTRRDTSTGGPMRPRGGKAGLPSLYPSGRWPTVSQRPGTWPSPRKKTGAGIGGKLDIAGERFVDITVASLDGKGCAKISQKISGPFRNPTLDKVSMLQSAAAPLMGLFEQTKKILTPGECKPFYTGSVAPPQ